MNKQTVFESHIQSGCILSHIESAFGIESRNVSEIHFKHVGIMLHIMCGKFEGWYDVHSTGADSNYFFISA